MPAGDRTNPHLDVDEQQASDHRATVTEEQPRGQCHQVVSLHDVVVHVARCARVNATIGPVDQENAWPCQHSNLGKAHRRTDGREHQEDKRVPRAVLVRNLTAVGFAQESQRTTTVCVSETKDLSGSAAAPTYLVASPQKIRTLHNAMKVLWLRITVELGPNNGTSS